MKAKHYALLICLLLTVILAALYLRSKVAAASPPPPENIDVNGGDATMDIDGSEDAATIDVATPEETETEHAEVFPPQEPTFEYWTNRIRRLREEQFAERAALGENPTPEARRAYNENYERRREEIRAAIAAADAVASPPDPRGMAWFPRYHGHSNYEAPPPVREDFYQYLLERYAGWDIARAEEERERLGTMELPADEIFFRRVELLHYIGILRHEAQDAPTPPEP